MNGAASLSRAVLFYALCTLLAVLMSTPFAWQILTAFKKPSEVISFPITWLPSSLYLENFSLAVQHLDWARGYMNTAIYAGVSTTGCVLFSMLAGFSFAKYDFPGKEIFFVLVLATLMLPFQIQMIPLYFITVKLGIFDTYVGLILPRLAATFGTFLARQYMSSIPDDFIDSARIDGCGELRIFLTIMFPMAIPLAGTIAIFEFMSNWNDFLWPLIVTNSPSLQVLSVALLGFTIPGTEQTLYGPLMAASLFVIVPVIVVFVLMQKRVIESITMTGLKF
jgi:multiple sugar transport system permease protein